MTKLCLVWWIHQAELEGRHSQSELGNEKTYAVREQGQETIVPNNTLDYGYKETNLCQLLP